MQYPIIDTIVEAYQRNGWTGLDISPGKNLAYIELIGQCPSVANGNIINYDVSVTTNLIEIEPNIDYTFTKYSEEHIVVIYVFSYDSNNTYIGVRSYDTTNSFSINFPSNVSYIRIRLDRYSSTEPIPIIQLEIGSESTQYEPYGNGPNDFPNRLKLPLPHYFPHPVIDALQRAAAGTQTADDTEVLRHYLTPFGIGGI